MVSPSQRSSFSFKDLWDRAYVGMMYFRRSDGRILRTNPTGKRILKEHSLSEKGMYLQDFFYTDTRAIQSEEGKHSLSFVGKAGESSGTIQASINQIESNLSVMIFVDISRLMIREKELMDSNRFLKTITNSAYDGVFFVDEKNFISYWNPSAQRIFGYSPVDIVGRQVKVLMGTNTEIPEFHKDFLPFQEDHISGLSARVLQENMKRMDGSEFIAELSLTLVQEKDEWAKIIIIRDISLRRKQEEEHKRLLEIESRNANMESISQLASGIAHDFNNVLSNIQGQSQVLEMKLPEESPLKNNVENITGQLQRASSIIENLMIVLGDFLPKPESIDLNSFLNLLREELEIPPNISLEVSVNRGDIQVWCDRNALRRILLEIVGNAESAIEKKVGEIEISVYQKNARETIIDVADTGCGMPEEIKNKIFQPYFTTQNFGAGAGLGLFAVFGLIKQNQGIIEVNSTPEAGSHFMITLPAKPMEGNKEA